MKKKILILTAGFGEGHNSAARGVRDGLARVASDQTTVELRDLFAEAYGRINELVRRSYLALVNSAPRAWGVVYRWLDRKTDYNTEFRRLTRLKAQFAPVLDRFQPDIVVCSFPAYANVLHGHFGSGKSLQMCGGCHGLDHDQLILVPEPGGLFSRCKRTKRQRAAERRSCARKNQDIWFSRQSKICRSHRRSAIAFQQFQPSGFIYDSCSQTWRGGTGAYARET